MFAIWLFGQEEWVVLRTRCTPAERGLKDPANGYVGGQDEFVVAPSTVLKPVNCSRRRSDWLVSAPSNSNGDLPC